MGLYVIYGVCQGREHAFDTDEELPVLLQYDNAPLRAGVLDDDSDKALQEPVELNGANPAPTEARQALGDPLVSHEERIKKAMTRVYALRPWTAMQRQWLERIEKQLITQTILDREDFDRGAFAEHGGFSRLNKIFQGNFQAILDEINTTLYVPERQSA